MGHELTTAGQIVTDASLALENQKIRRAELELENKRLEELVKANTLTPTVPGVYGGRNAQGNHLGSSAPHSVRSSDDSNLIVAGVDVRKSDYFSDAEQVEQRYGDVASSVYGGAVIAADGYQTARKSPFEKWWGDQRSTALGNVETRNKIVSEHDERERRKRRRGDHYFSDPSYIQYPTYPPDRAGYPR